MRARALCLEHRERADANTAVGQAEGDGIRPIESIDMHDNVRAGGREVEADPNVDILGDLDSVHEHPVRRQVDRLGRGDRKWIRGGNEPVGSRAEDAHIASGVTDPCVVESVVEGAGVADRDPPIGHDLRSRREGAHRSRNPRRRARPTIWR